MPLKAVKTIEESSKTLSHDDLVLLKSSRLVNIGNITKKRINQPGGNYYIEVINIEKMATGVAVFAKAWWPNGEQIGFGKDGTVEIERFIMPNPRVLVLDPKGTIERKRGVIDAQTGSYEPDTYKIEKYREDTKEALLQELAHTISVKKQKFDSKNIIKGKIGSTTLTKYPVAGSSTAPNDTTLYQFPEDTWVNHRDDTNANINDVTTTSIQARIRAWTGTNKWISLMRATVGFDTSSIGTDNIDSATLSIYPTSNADNFNQDLALDFHNSVSGAGFTGTDYNKTNYDEVDQMTRVDVTSGITLSAYNDFTLNSTGEGNINKSGNTYLAFRMSGEMDDSPPTWASNVSSQVIFNSADTSGTTTDPKLVVEHSAASSATDNALAMCNF